ncbi:hypothetical protein CEE36_02780 [candidate division TA06 bacterium B3_TA06]|uniref:Secretion system C-terminal sorting domain-containing protein n=1 Tax=candidate division TA06 bacterium B3_TA06 TaxID=2012487 RepID=A0A532V8T1_UNCT6|nr:MAG: hypothetical protein CEE36_02780 [candidate division TA06 bacterium B3_TA06]
MKRFSLILILASVALAVIPTQLVAGWWRTYGGAENDVGRCVRQTPDGGYIVLGHTYSFQGGPMWLLKLDPNGDTVWTRLYNGSAENIYLTSDGGYLIAGGKNDNLWLLKLKENGDTSWTRTYGKDSLLDYGIAAFETEDGGYMLFGRTESFATNEWDEDVWMLRTDAKGDTLWTKIYGGEEDDILRCVHPTHQKGKGYIMLVTAYSYMGDQLVKVDTAGEVQSEGEVWVGLHTVYMNDVVNGYLVTCWVHPSGGEYNISDIYLAKTEFGSLELYEWDVSWGSEYYDLGYYVALTNDFSCVVTGVWGENGPSEGDLFLAKRDLWDGWGVWQRIYGGDSSEWGNFVEQTSDEGYIVVGGTESFGAGGSDIYILKTDSLGYVGVEEESVADRCVTDWDATPIGREIMLMYKDRPEGFHAAVFDESGQKVDELHSTLHSGSVMWGEGHSPGVYFIMPTDGELSKQKVILIR